MPHVPRKRFGQHFLQDEHVISCILESMALKRDDHVIEIGPGLGALTKPLLGLLNELTAIEIDRDLYKHLEKMYSDSQFRKVFVNKNKSIAKFNLIAGDALRVDYGQWTQLRLVGNLPYAISMSLLHHFLRYRQKIVDMHFMLQKEVALRLAAQPGSKAYGCLSILIQFYCKVDYLFDIHPKAFHPPPKVNSAMVRLTPYVASPYREVKEDRFREVVKLAFSMRRKTLANNLKSLLSSAGLQEMGINPMLRPEQISIIDYIRIVNLLFT